MSAIPRRTVLGWPRVLTTGVLVGVAAALVSTLLAYSYTEQVGWDFRFEYFAAAESVVHGRSPYPPLDDPALRAALEQARVYPYPPLLAVALVPLTILPVDAANVLALLVSMASLVAALAIVGVRDLRCYAAAMVWSPTWSALNVVNVSAVMTLGIALAWRYRSTVWPLAVTLGLSAAVKLFLWPLIVWAVATRRLRAAAWAVVAGGVATLVSWAAIGFQGLASFPDLLRLLTDVWAENSYSLVGIAAALGLDPGFGRVFILVAGFALLAGCVHLGRRGDDLGAFTCAIAAALAITPIVWLHYVLFLLVPLGVARPRFSVVWLAPVVLWVCPLSGNGDGFQPLLPAVVVAYLVWFLIARARAGDAVPEAV